LSYAVCPARIHRDAEIRKEASHPKCLALSKNSVDAAHKQTFLGGCYGLAKDVIFEILYLQPVCKAWQSASDNELR
jgi:hypothetical protein